MWADINLTEEDVTPGSLGAWTFVPSNTRTIDAMNTNQKSAEKAQANCGNPNCTCTICTCGSTCDIGNCRCGCTCCK